MTRLDIRLFGDPVLRQQARTVTDFDDRLVTLARNMHETMQAARGVGLAANQVGVLKRLFTWSDGEDDGHAGSVVNPRLLDASEELQDGDEGCLSFPGLFYPLDRPLRVQVAWQDLAGEGHEVELVGFLARVWLHEMDHLDGVLFIDHLARHDRKAAMRAMRQMREERGGGDDRPRPGSLLLGRRRDGTAL